MTSLKNMKKNNFDYIVIGAGPAGLFFTYALAAKKKGKKILLIDKGHEYDNRFCPILHGKNICSCPTCNIISGIGGSAFYIPAKLSNYPAGSKLATLFNNKSDFEKSYDEVLEIFSLFGLNIKKRNDFVLNGRYLEYFNSAKRNNILLKYYLSQEFTKDNFADFISKLINELKKLNVDIKSNTEIDNINKHNHSFYLVDTKENEYQCNKLIIATGEKGAFWLNDIIKNLKVKKKETSIDIGIRIEFSQNIIKEIYEFHKDPKLIFKAPDGSELRTYCTLSNGKVVICKNDDFSVVDGIHCNYDNGKGAMTIFNRVVPSKCMLKYAKEISKTVNTKCDGKIAISTMGELLYRRPNEKVSKPTLGYTKIVALNEIIPEQILENIKFGIKSLSSVIKGLNNPHNTVYYPAIDKLWHELVLKPNFETTVKNLHIIGDSTGIARGIFQSAMMGYSCANKI